MNKGKGFKDSLLHNQLRKEIEERKKAEKFLKRVHIELEERIQKRTAELAATNKALRSEIAERKKIEEELAKEKKLLAETLQSIADGVVTTDIQGNITSVNQMAEKITGWKQAEALGRPLKEIFQIGIDEKIPGSCRDPLKYLLEASKKRVLTNYLKLYDQNEDRKIIFANAAPIEDEDEFHSVIGYVIAFRDVTKQKKLETQLALSQRLQSIGELAAGIAHEINTPMQYIGDNTRFLQDAAAAFFALLGDYQRLKNKFLVEEDAGLLIDKINKKEQEMDIAYLLEEIPRAFKEALEGIEKVDKIVLAMKEFAHPGKKKKTPADINKAIRDTVVISRNEWKYVAELKTDLEPGLPLVYCVVSEINQVLLNMIVNAAQAIKEVSKEGVLSKGEIKIKTSGKKDHVNISVSDNGIGIPEAALDKIFEPFFTTKEVGQGTGQGLAIAHDIIATKHKGSIRVRSKVGKGTEFIIRLPVKS
ncbi:MAG: PAS domain S-box protein [Firmicutes bacterium]|nr:PAS domain S-box protein [Bacillota bacterium]